MSEVDNCFEKGLLKKITKNTNLALQDIEQAEFFLNESFDLLKINKKEMATIALYSSIFHAGRALLFQQGVKEKSYYCLQKYLEEKFVKTKILNEEELSLFDLLRGMRQEIQYNVTKIKLEENIEELYNKTENFVEKIKKLLLKK